MPLSPNRIKRFALHMERRLPACLILTALAVLFASIAAAQNELQVFVPPNLKTPIHEISGLFEKSNSPWKFVPTVGRSRDLAQNLKQGAPLDVVISSSKEEMERLIKQGYVSKNTQHLLFSDGVVIVALATSPLEVKQPKDLAAESVNKAALPPLKTNFGKQCRAYLDKTGVTEALKNRTTGTKNIPAALKLLKANDAQWTFMYGTDAASAKELRVVWVVPSSEIPETEYFAGMITKSKNPKIAKLFLETLQSTIAKRIFENAGFRLPGQPPRIQVQPQTQPQSQTQTPPRSQKPTQTQPQTQPTISNTDAASDTATNANTNAAADSNSTADPVTKARIILRLQTTQKFRQRLLHLSGASMRASSVAWQHPLKIIASQFFNGSHLFRPRIPANTPRCIKRSVTFRPP